MQSKDHSTAFVLDVSSKAGSPLSMDSEISQKAMNNVFENLIPKSYNGQGVLVNGDRVSK